MTKRLVVMSAVCAVILAAQLCWSAEDPAIWQLGKSDNGYNEFAIAGNYNAYRSRFPRGVNVRIGERDPAEDWPFVQPGPADGWAGSRRHPQEITFDLKRAPEALYLLKIDFVDVHSQIPPTLRIRVNDKVQDFELNPGAADASLTNAENGREQIVRMYVPGPCLRDGTNTVILTLVRGSWVIYDCVSMTRCVNPPKPVEDLSLRQTFLFKESKQGLRQILRASMDLYDDLTNVRAEVSGEGGWKAEQTFKKIGSGPASIEIEVPPVTTRGNAHLKLTVRGDVYEADCTVTPQKRWRIYLAPSSHFDLGYTGPQEKCLRIHRENIERAIDWCSKYPGFVWNMEGSYLAEDFLQNSPRKNAFLRLAKEGKLGVQGFYGNELTGICSNEGLIRLLDYHDYLRHEYGIGADCIMETDVPTMVGTVPMILAGHGIEYASQGCNLARTAPYQESFNTPYYWQSPDGSRVLMWKTYGYAQASIITGAGDQASMKTAQPGVDRVLRRYADRSDYPYDAILLHGGYSDNRPNGSAMPSVIDQWNRTYAYPKIICCTGPEFFKYIETNFAGEIKTVRGDGGVYWEDGAGSSAFETAETRIAKEQLVTAGKLAAFCGTDFQRKIADDLSEAWKNALLYDEHTWGAAQSISAPDSEPTRQQWAVKKAFADRAAELANKALASAAAEFSSRANPREDSVVVFNPSSWERSGWVDVDTGSGSNRLYAESVPPLGYKVYSLSKCVAGIATGTQGDTLDNRFYTVRFDKKTGFASSIYDKELNRELIDPSAYEANSFLYVTGRNSKEDPLKMETAGLTMLSKQTWAGGQIMSGDYRGSLLPRMQCDVILYNDVKRIDFVNRLDKRANLGKEAGYFAFPFAFKNPEIRLEIPDGVIRPDIDQFPGACRDWYAVQQFVTVSDGSAAVTWTPVDSPLITLQDINRGQWYKTLKMENGNVFGYVFNNCWNTNYKASQDGRLAFRFSMTSGKSISDLQAKQFGESVMTPMVATVVRAKSGAKPTAPTSLLEVEGDGVVVQAMKPARFADGTVVRLREMSGRTQSVRLIPKGISYKSAYLCNLAEDKLAPLAVKDGALEVKCGKFGLTTVLLER